MKHTHIGLSNTTRKFRVLDRWMRETATLLQGFRYYTPEYRPFQELEVPGVSLLLAAAASAGYYPISEYKISKFDRSDRRKTRPGRADLWFIANDKSYSFEFKRAWDISSKAQLEQCMSGAFVDICDIPSSESDYAFAAVIAPVFDGACLDIYNAFNAGGLNFHIGTTDHDVDVFFFFKERI